MASKIMTKAKPRLYLLGGTRIEAEHVAALFHALTGRVTTPAQVEECRQALDQAYERLAATQSVQEGGCMPASDDRKKVAPANDQREGEDEKDAADQAPFLSHCRENEVGMTLR